MSVSVNNNPYEIHITVRNDTHGIERFQDICRWIGGKALILSIPDKNMNDWIFTANREHLPGVAAIDDIMSAVSTLSGVFRSDSMRVIREKVEVPYWSVLAPKEGERITGVHYWEVHFKFNLFDDGTAMAMNKCKKIMPSLKWSHNADDASVFYATHRMYMGTRSEFLDSTIAFARMLSVQRLIPVKTISEYCLFDSNVKHDGY